MHKKTQKGGRMTKGKFVVIEGADATGKDTQAQMIVEDINQSSVLGENKAVLFKFPSISNPYGKIIRNQYLAGEWGDVYDVDPYVAAKLFIDERKYVLPSIRDVLADGRIAISVRWVESNLAYQGAKIKDEQQKIDFYKWNLDLEYAQNNLLVPDLRIILKLDTDVAAQRIISRGDSDIHDRNIEYQKDTVREYENLISGRYDFFDYSNMHIIDCSPEGKELSREDIFLKIKEAINRVV